MRLVRGVREAVARATVAVRAVASYVRTETAGLTPSGLDARRKDFLGEGAKLFLLKAGGGVTAYGVLEILTESWDVRELDGVGPALLVAKADAEYNDKAREASHAVIVDSTNEAVNNQVFEINRNTTVPAGIRPVWQIGVRFTGKRYIPA